MGACALRCGAERALSGVGMGHGYGYAKEGKRREGFEMRCSAELAVSVDSRQRPGGSVESFWGSRRVEGVHGRTGFSFV